jgi:hypothetical protein
MSFHTTSQQPVTLCTLRNQLRELTTSRDSCGNAALRALLLLKDGLTLPTDRDELAAVLGITVHYQRTAWPEHQRAVDLVKKICALEENISTPSQSPQPPDQQGSEPVERDVEPDPVYARTRAVFEGFSVLKKPEKESVDSPPPVQSGRRWPDAKQPIWKRLCEALRRMGIRIKWATSWAHYARYRDEIEHGAAALAEQLGITLDELIERIAAEFKTLHRTPSMPGLVDCWTAIRRNICASLRAWSSAPNARSTQPPTAQRGQYERLDDDARRRGDSLTGWSPAHDERLTREILKEPRPQGARGSDASRTAMSAIKSIATAAPRRLGFGRASHA